MSRSLALVMPVYNEEECIVHVLNSWLATFDRLGIDYQAIVLDDGSRDGTSARLAVFEGNSRVECITKPNEGHGPTILRGYHKAVDCAEWVFQCDSDDEMSPDHFELLWHQRDDYDALFGYRLGRAQDPLRKLVTLVSRAVVQALFGSQVRDVNTPYRLIRSGVLQGILARIPADTFAPNVLIAGAISLGGLRVAECAVPHEPRRTGQVSLVRLGVLKAATRSFLQTIRFRFSRAAPAGRRTGERSVTN